MGATLLASFAGAVALTATWSTTTAVAELLGADHPLNVTNTLLGLEIGGLSMLLYAVLLLLFVSVSFAYQEVVLTYLTPRGVSLPLQALDVCCEVFRPTAP